MRKKKKVAAQTIDLLLPLANFERNFLKRFYFAFHSIYFLFLFFFFVFFFVFLIHPSTPNLKRNSLFFRFFFLFYFFFFFIFFLWWTHSHHKSLFSISKNFKIYFIWNELKFSVVSAGHKWKKKNEKKWKQIQENLANKHRKYWKSYDQSILNIGYAKQFYIDFKYTYIQTYSFILILNIHTYKHTYIIDHYNPSVRITA